MDSNDKLFGVLAYLEILVLIPIFAGKTEFTRYHANQGLVLLIASAILGVAAVILNIILAFIPFVGWIIGGLISGVVGLACLALAIIGIVHVCNGEMKPLPVIGGITILK